MDYTSSIPTTDITAHTTIPTPEITTHTTLQTETISKHTFIAKNVQDGPMTVNTNKDKSNQIKSNKFISQHEQWLYKLICVIVGDDQT